MNDAVRGVRDSKSASQEAAEPPFSYAAGTRLVGRWRSDPAFSEDGIPRPLALTGPGSFTALARSANVDAAIARQTLRRLGLIRVKAGQVTLLTDAYVPARGTAEKLDILARDGAEFLQTMLHNVSSKPTRALLQRKTSYDNIGGARVPALLSTLRQRGTEALLAADALLAAADRDRTPSAAGGRRMRVSFGVYCACEPVVSRTAARRKRTTSRRRTS
jgi:hypothetical protein